MKLFLGQNISSLKERDSSEILHARRQNLGQCLPKCAEKNYNTHTETGRGNKNNQGKVD